MDRRKFLKNTSLVSAGSLVLAGLPVKLMEGNPDLEQAAMAASNDNVLVLVQMHGGNDGLNCVVPINQYSTYLSLRPNIAIPNQGARKLISLDTTLILDEQIGIHPDMLPFKQMYEQGLSSVVQNVGFEDMNLSHFRGRDIMFMGGGPTDYFNSGWMGRLMDFQYPGYPDSYPNPQMLDPIALEIGNSTSLAFHRENGIPIGFSIDSPEAFYNLINGVGVAPPILFPDSHAGEELRYLMEFEKKSNQYAQRLKDVYNAGSNTASVNYPQTYPYSAPVTAISNPLSGQLRLIARLLKGGCKTRIFMCRIGGFDTHANQVEKFDTTMGTHAALVFHLFGAMKAFYDDLKGLGFGDKVLSMTFTEFGRRVYSNASYGSDHGTSFPVFLFGKGLKPGIVGNNPDLSDLNGGNLRYKIDYRQVYTTVAQDWFGASDEALTATKFNEWLDKKIGLFGTTGIDDVEDEIKSVLHDCYPNPASEMVNVSFFITPGSDVRLSLHDPNGRKVAEILNEYRFYGETTVTYDISQLPAGFYLYKLETREFNAAKKLVVRSSL
ncbi:MAG: DUF1501 domain-containing protein [Bacteroidales bacterium]|nr:DUF1501 domain-containing protein [Bacteroidales bacterium]